MTKILISLLILSAGAGMSAFAGITFDKPSDPHYSDWTGNYAPIAAKNKWQFPDNGASFQATICDQQVKYCFGQATKKNGAVCRANSKGECPKDPNDCAAGDNTVVLSNTGIEPAAVIPTDNDSKGTTPGGSNSIDLDKIKTGGARAR